MARLIPCPACGSLVKHGDVRCPACEAPIGDRTVTARSAGAMLVLGLALTGCPADDGSETMAEGSATAPTASSTNGDTGTSSATEGDESSTAPATTALYGNVETSSSDTDTTSGSSSSGSDSGSDAATDTDATGSGTDSATTSGPGPLYGAAET